MGTLHNETTQEITCEQLRESLCVKTRTWQARWAKRIGTAYDKDAILSEQQRAMMAATSRTKQAAPKPPKPPKQAPSKITPDYQPQQIQSPAQETPETYDLISEAQALKLFSWTSALAVIAHSILVWYDCANLWKVPGFIGGCVAFLLVFAAILLSLTRKKVTAKIASRIAIVVDALAVKVHYPTFVEHGDVDPGTSLGFAIFLCAGSASLIYLFNHEKHGRV